MNSPAAPRELIRRACFDLIGLPPAPDEVAAFERDASDRAWIAVVDRLLASPRYGERWGRHWLDLARFAESNGYERDGPKPNAWRYRDYVIDAFNADKPYDRFISEQLAGDEIADEWLTGVGTKDWRDAIVATGFYRLHVWDDEPDSTLAAEYDDIDDVIVTTSTAFLGLTIGCARCHNHKFDPISQADYYSFLSFFRGIDPYGLPHKGGGGRGTGKIRRALASKPDVERWDTQQSGQIKDLENRLKGASGPAKQEIEAELKRVRETPPPFDFALAVAENGPTPKPTHILARGDPNSPRAEVSPAFPVVFGQAAPILPSRPAGASASGRRTALANWIASDENPMTARVLVNRLWQHHFGAGLVPTPDDFGQTGVRPLNQELLDYLAAEFMEHGWSIKHVHKLIMASAAYRMSSRTDNSAGLAHDQANEFFWRQSLRRIESEAIRDTMLAVSGSLNLRAGGLSVFPTLPKVVHGTQDSAGKGWVDSPPSEQHRRSVYLVVKRALKVPLLDCLDFANSASPVGARPITTTAPQALMLLNDSFVQERAKELAARLQNEGGSEVDSRISRGFQIVLQRAPTPPELKSARAFLTRANETPDSPILVSFCRALLNLNEMIYID